MERLNREGWNENAHHPFDFAVTNREDFSGVRAVFFANRADFNFVMRVRFSSPINTPTTIKWSKSIFGILLKRGENGAKAFSQNDAHLSVVPKHGKARFLDRALDPFPFIRLTTTSGRCTLDGGSGGRTSFGSVVCVSSGSTRVKSFCEVVWLSNFCGDSSACAGSQPARKRVKTRRRKPST